jgi:hypothetical protein
MLILELQWRLAYSLESAWQGVIKGRRLDSGSSAPSQASGYLPQNSVADCNIHMTSGRERLHSGECLPFVLPVKVTVQLGLTTNFLSLCSGGIQFESLRNTNYRG